MTVAPGTGAPSRSTTKPETSKIGVSGAPDADELAELVEPDAVVVVAELCPPDPLVVFSFVPHAANDALTTMRAGAQAGSFMRVS
jgi:hypothetical protein